MSENPTPTLQAVLDRAIRAALASMRQCLPASVVSYDNNKRNATVQPLLWEAHTNSEGLRVAERLPLITNVPVLFPGSGGARVRYPVRVGDTVLLLFSSASLDRWLVRGGELDPEDDRRHDLNDAVALPGFSSLVDADDADIMIEFTDTQILAGGSAALALAAELNNLRAQVASHTHLYIPGPGTGTVPSTPPDNAVALGTTDPGTQKLRGA